MDIKDFKYFLAVSEQLNFSVAARDLYISQPTLSLRISTLEEELGIRLFERNKKKVYLTTAGARLLPLVKDIIEKTDQILALVQNCSNDIPENGSLKIGMDKLEDDYSRFSFYSSFSEIKNHYPGIDLDITPVSYNAGLSALKNCELDLCILLMRPDESLPSVFNSYLILQEETAIVTAKLEIMTIEELLKKAKLVMPNDQRWDSLYLDFFRNHGIPFSIEYTSNRHAMHMLMHSASHISIMPKSIMKHLNLEGVKSFSFDPPIYVNMVAVWLKTNINPVIQILLDTLLPED